MIAISKKEQNLILKIIERAENAGYILITSESSRNHLTEILNKAREVYDINLKHWLESDGLNFAIDFNGIVKNYKKEGDDVNFGNFTPRFVNENMI